jgi:hypothetical protein
VVADVPALSLIHPPERASIIAPPLTARAWLPAPAEPVEFTVKLVLPVAPAIRLIDVPVALETVVEVAERELTAPEDTRLNTDPFRVTPPVPVFVKSIPPFAPVARDREPKVDAVPPLKLRVDGILMTPEVLIVSAVKPPFRLVAPSTRPPVPLLEIVSAPLVPAPRVILAKAPVVPALKFRIEVVGTVP